MSRPDPRSLQAPADPGGATFDDPEAGTDEPGHDADILWRLCSAATLAVVALAAASLVLV